MKHDPQSMPIGKDYKGSRQDVMILRIVSALFDGPMTVPMITVQTRVSPKLVGRHIHRLRAKGILIYKTKGFCKVTGNWLTYYTIASSQTWTFKRSGYCFTFSNLEA